MFAWVVVYRLRKQNSAQQLLTVGGVFVCASDNQFAPKPYIEPSIHIIQTSIPPYLHRESGRVEEKREEFPKNERKRRENVSVRNSALRIFDGIDPPSSADPREATSQDDRVVFFASGDHFLVFSPRPVCFISQVISVVSF